MAGTWRRRGSSIELRVYLGRDPLTGRERYTTRTVALMGKRDADRAAAAFAAELAGGRAATPASRTFGELLERWFDARSASWSPGTAYQTRWVIDRRLAGLRDRPLRSIDTAMLDEFYAALRTRGGQAGRRLSVSSVVRVHGIVRLALDQAVHWDWLTANPAVKANPGTPPRPQITPPAAEDVTRLLAAAEAEDPELLAYLFMDAETGARRGELAALRLGDMGEDEVAISRALTIGLLTEENLAAYAGHIWPTGNKRGKRPTALIEKPNPKNDSSVRRIALGPATIALVAEQRHRVVDRASLAGTRYDGNGFLFPADLGGTRPLRPDTWTRRFARLRDSLGLRTRLHDVRHFVATTLLTSGVDLVTVAGRLGHGGGGKTTLAIYGHFRRAPDRIASDVMTDVLLPKPTAPVDLPANVVPLRARRSGRRAPEHALRPS